MILALMPLGVEHQNVSFLSLTDEDDVILALMPLGVEHIASVYDRLRKLK